MNNFFDKAKEFFQRVPEAPTNPQKQDDVAEFRIEDLYESDRSGSGPIAAGLDEKLRQAYFWITNTAIISPFMILNTTKTHRELSSSVTVSLN